MSRKPLLGSETLEYIQVGKFQDIVNAWLTRKDGTEDIRMIQQAGGDAWLLNGVQSDSAKGIDPSSIKDREARWGSNRKKEVPLKTFWEWVNESLEDFTLQILIVAGVASIIIDEIMEAEHRDVAWIEGASILLAVVIIVLVTVLNNMKKDKEFHKLNDLAEKGKKITIVRNGVQNEEGRISEVVVGDLVLLKQGMEVAGDGIVLEGYTLQMDESSMTGETKPMTKDSVDKCLKKQQELVQQHKEIQIHDLPSPVILSGTRVLNGSGSMIVINVGANSSIGKIQQLISSGEEELTPLQLKLEKIAREVGTLGLYSAITIFCVLVLKWFYYNSTNGGLGWQTKSFIVILYELLEFFMMGVTLLVVAIPEGLPLAVTLSLAYSVGKMTKDNNLVRKLAACETMGGANYICTDKTGTLTRNEMFMVKFWNLEQTNVYDAQTDKAAPLETYIKQDLIPIFKDAFIFNSSVDPTKKTGNPTELAMIRYLHQCGIEVVKHRSSQKTYTKADFNSDRKRMSTIIEYSGDPKQFVCYIKGASEYILECCNKFIDLQSGQISPITTSFKQDALDNIKLMATQSLRTIGVAYKVVDPAKIDIEKADAKGVFGYEKDDFIFVGVCGIKDIIRAEVPRSIELCHKAGINVKMVTGDNAITAKAIAKEVGIIDHMNENTALVLEGPEFMNRVGGIVCDNCRSKPSCDCVLTTAELKEP